MCVYTDFKELQRPHSCEYGLPCPGLTPPPQLMTAILLSSRLPDIRFRRGLNASH